MQVKGRYFFALWILVSGLARAAPYVVHVQDAAGQPLADAVVAVQLRGQPSRTGPHGTAQMAQRARRFEPAVLVVQTGTAVTFPNFDTVRHHVYSFSATRKFDIKLYAGTPAQPEVFDKPGVVMLGCNIHDAMSAHIVVVDTPLFTKSDAAGAATLDLPPGEHLLSWWHPKLGGEALRSRTIQVGGSAGAHTTLTVTSAE
jgi:plastocyanin